MSFLSKFRIPWRLRGARVEAFCLRCGHRQHKHYVEEPARPLPCQSLSLRQRL